MDGELSRDMDVSLSWFWSSQAVCLISLQEECGLRLDFEHRRCRSPSSTPARAQISCVERSFVLFVSGEVPNLDHTAFSARVRISF